MPGRKVIQIFVTFSLTLNNVNPKNQGIFFYPIYRRIKINIYIVIFLQFRAAEWREAFDEMDTDKSGQLSVDEVFEGLKRAGCGMRKCEVINIVNSVDKDGDQSLTFEEFVTLMRL